MTTLVACPTPILQFFDNQGNPAVGGSVLTQVDGVNYPTYQDVNGTTVLPNPIPLNSRGEVSTAAGASSQLFLEPNTTYTFTLYDANGNQLNQSTYVDGVQPSGETLAADLNPVVDVAILNSLLRSAAEISAGVTPVNYSYAVGESPRYATLAQWALILGSCKGKLIGSNSVSSTVTIPSGAYVEWEAGATLSYTGSGAALALSSVKDVTLVRPTIDISGAGSSAIAIQLNGAWLVDIEHPKIIAASAANSQQGIQINTSASAGANFGAYCIRILNANICASNTGGQVQYGILTQQTASDTVAVTHLQVQGGWINSGTTAAIKLEHASSFRIEGTTVETCVDGVQFDNCDDGFLSLGEVDATGYAINPLSSSNSNIGIVYPSKAGSYTLGYVNSTNWEPDLIGLSGELRMYPNGTAASKYFVSYKSQFTATAVLLETVNAGGTPATLRNVDSTLTHGTQQLMNVAGVSSTATASKNLAGIATFAAGTTVAVTFANAEADANYVILLGPQGNPGGNLWVSAQATTGFTLNCSSSTSVSVAWMLVR